ncbi:ImpA family type VI secretion system protein, partial [Pigmentiphaga soli]|uniref:type VI secretion system protein TssA n=1 Tax=Pigmentiphaga soli TaxID=1007095 RepID=UPI003CD0B76D
AAARAGEAAGAADGAAPAAQRTDGLPAAGAAPLPVRSAPGTIASRQDALRALDLVCEYLERHEPTNPAPLLIRRACSLMDKGFLEIVRELAPDGLRQVEVIVGSPP